ncbi:MAG: lysylphosphatidylglycerol synthase domain-containing protein [Alphaproteobacteria bacterium]|nr:lysylphosphatidylglycerol synthase domain-containing protein [Alphaproteobacteria bacterium]
MSSVIDVPAKSKRLLKKLVAWSGLFFFALAVGMLYWQLRHYSLLDIWRALRHIPVNNLFYAALACLAGYLVLSFYDYMALRYIGQSKKVAWWKWMLAGLVGFAVSNNAGNAWASGGAIRYRLYTRWRIKTSDIVKMLTFNGFTYFLGAIAIVVGGYFLVPNSLFNNSVGASIGIYGLFLFCTAALGAYFALTVFFQKKTVHIGGIDFKIPSTRVALLQMFVGIMDSVLAGLVLYFCMMNIVDIPFTMFIGIFVMAQTAGVFAPVPGGIGVFDSIILAALSGFASPAALFGALLAYRVIYYIIPLIGTGSLFILYENFLRARMKRWLAEAKHAKWLEETKRLGAKTREKLSHIPHPHLPKFKKNVKREA